MSIDDNVELDIGSKTRANEIMRSYPETTDYFMELGVCGCEFDGKFGALKLKKTIEEIAQEKGISPRVILDKLKKIIG